MGRWVGGGGRGRGFGTSGVGSRLGLAGKFGQFSSGRPRWHQRGCNVDVEVDVGGVVDVDGDGGVDFGVLAPPIGRGC